MNNKILCVGEILWDSFPKGLFLGGAPFNVACHLQMLGADCRMISRVGTDVLGEQALLRLRQKGMSTEFVQMDQKYRTGIVDVNLDAKGNASYNIVEPAAWDFIEQNEPLISYARSSQVLIFGSLAQRRPESRSAIQALRKTVPVTVFDVNLRPPYDNPDIVKQSLENTSIVKLNDTELLTISKWFGFPPGLKEAAGALADSFGNEMICITKGECGAALWHKGSWSEHPGYIVNVKDTVGSGDAFLAALVAGLLKGRESCEILSNANAVGAYVASCDGATPVLDLDEIHVLQNSRERND